MDLIRMVWHCLDCGKDFNRKSGEHHRIHSDHNLQRQLKGHIKPTEHQYFSVDDVDPQRSDSHKYVPNVVTNDVVKSATIYNTRKTITKHEKQLNSRRVLKNYFLQEIREIRKQDERFLSWLKMKREEYVIKARFGAEFCQEIN